MAAAAKIDQPDALTLSPASKAYDGSDITLTGGGGNGGRDFTSFVLKSAPSGAPAGSTVTANGDGETCTLHPTKAGTYTITVTKAGNSTYNAKTQDVTVTVGLGTQTITGLSNVEKTYGDADFTVSATATAGGVTFGVPENNGVATVTSGGTVHIVGAGTVTITATAAATDLYDSQTATATLTVNKATPTVTVTASPSTIRVGGTATLSGSSTSGETVTFSVPADNVVATLSGSTLTGVGYGTVTVTGSVDESANYLAGSGTCTVTVKLAVPTTQVSISKGTGTPTDGATHFEVHLDSRGATPGRGTHWLMLVKAGGYPTTPAEGVGSSASKGQGSTEGNVKSLTSSFAVAWPTDASSLIVYNGTATSAGNYWFKDAIPATHYYVAAYEYNREGSTVASFVYNTTETSANRFNFWTLASQPGAPSLTGSQTGVSSAGSRKATLSWTAASWTAASGESAALKYLVVVKKSTDAAVEPPVDGETYAVGATRGGGTVFYADAGTVSSGTVTAEITGLDPDTDDYTVYVYAYTQGGDATTANYNTSALTFGLVTIPSQGPTVQAAGVDTTGYLLNWGTVAGDSAGYDVQTRASGGSWASAGTALPGYNKPVTGLTSGNTYEARVRKSPDGDWSDELSVKAGVKPNTVSASAVRNAVTFTWTDVQSGAAGYGVQVTKTAAASSLYTKTCPDSALGRNSFSSGQQWKYTGDQITCDSGNFGTSPGYRSSYGHILIGTGQTLESDAFALDGMTALQLKFTIAVHNSTSGTAANQVNAYYQVNGGVWNWLGSANTATSHTLTVPQGASDEASTIAFRLVAPNASVATGNGYFIGPAISAISVKATAKGSGDYDAPVIETTTTSRSYTVTGLTAGETVYFRVQALQGSTATPTAKSVWVEQTGTASAYTPPGTPEASGILRNAMTLTWTAGNTTDLDHYVLQVGTASGFGAGTYTEY